MHRFLIPHYLYRSGGAKMDDLIIKLFKCVSRRNAILMIIITSLNLLMAIALFVLTIVSKMSLDTSVDVYLITSILSFAWALTAILMLEDNRKICTNGDSPVGIQGHFVHNYFEGEYRNGRSRRVWASILTGLFIFYTVSLLLPALRIDGVDAGSIVGISIPMVIILVVIIRLLAEDITLKNQLDMLENGEFTYTKVTAIDRYVSFASRRRFSFEYRRSKFIVVMDSDGNRGRFRVNDHKLEASAYAKHIYVIHPNRKLGPFEEPLLYLSNGSFEEAEEQYYENNFRFI